MADINSQKIDYLQSSDMCLEICNDKAVKLGDWTERDINLFVQQFQEAQLEPVVDMSKLDYKAFPRTYFEKKFPGFEDHVIDALYECENKKLEDDRLCPLRVLRDKVGTLQISNDTNKYNAPSKKDQEAEEAEGTTEGEEQEAEGKGESQPEPETDSNCADRARWFQTSQEEED